MSTSDLAVRGVSSSPGSDEAPGGKLPEITALFWVVTVLIAGLGQATADWLIGTGDGLPGLGLYGALGIEVGLFVVALALQLAMRRYIPPVYWLAVFGVAVFGTLVADVMHFLIGIPSWALPPIFAVVLAVNFLVAYLTEHSLSIQTIRTRRREISYWVAALFIFALGTAVVDLATLEWHVSTLLAAVIFLVLILLVGALFTRFRAAAVLLFWVAYVLTRPLAGALSDWLVDDLGLGAGTVTLATGVLAVVVVGYLTVAHQRTRGWLGATRDTSDGR